MPRCHGFRPRGTFLAGKKFRKEIDIATARNFCKRLIGLVQLDVLPNEIAVRDSISFADLFFSPAVQTIARPGSFFQRRVHLQRLPHDEVFCFLVTCIVDYRERQRETFVYVFDALFADLPCRTRYSAGSEKVFDDVLKLILAKLTVILDSDFAGKSFNLRCVPIPGIELFFCECACEFLFQI